MVDVIDVANTIIANSFSAGLLRDFGLDVKTVSHTLFLQPAGDQGAMWLRAVDVVGMDGNIVSGSPVSGCLGGEYRLRSDSPAIDAADTSEAPETGSERGTAFQ